MELTSLDRLQGDLKAKVTRLEQFETPSCLELRPQLNVSALRNQIESLRKDYYSLPSDVDSTEADRELELLEDPSLPDRGLLGMPRALTESAWDL
ncbi:UNVERIFIED_CONTAM: hypothetical protein NCL1_26753 [Trichonephila clavipes]